MTATVNCAYGSLEVGLGYKEKIEVRFIVERHGTSGDSYEELVPVLHSYLPFDVYVEADPSDRMEA